MFLFFLGGLYICGSAASSLLHGSVCLDAGGGSAALEQSGCSQPERGQTHEVLLSHRLGYKGFFNSSAPVSHSLMWKAVNYFPVLPLFFLSFSPGLPVLIVTITLSSASGKYSADGYCWLSVQNGVIWGFTGPVIFIIMVSGLCPTVYYHSHKKVRFKIVGKTQHLDIRCTCNCGNVLSDTRNLLLDPNYCH